MKIISNPKKINVSPHKSETVSTKNIATKPSKKKSCLKDTNNDLLENLSNSQSDSESIGENILISESIGEISKAKEETYESNEFIKHLQKNELDLFNNIYTACLTNDFEKLKQLFSSSAFTIHGSKNTNECETSTEATLINKLLNKRMNEDKGYTLLHMTSELGHADCVWLLLFHGSDPTIEDLTKVHAAPYVLGANKATSNLGLPLS